MDLAMQAAWRKMVGAALLWVGLAALVYVPTAAADGGVKTALVAGLGFVSFSVGVSLLMEAFQRAAALKAPAVDRE